MVDMVHHMASSTVDVVHHAASGTVDVVSHRASSTWHLLKEFHVFLQKGDHIMFSRSLSNFK